jgi:hypothetical protein
MKLFIESMFLSAASTNERTAEDETPRAAGLLRGKSAPQQMELLNVTTTMMERASMNVTLVRKIGKQVQTGFLNRDQRSRQQGGGF